MFLPLQFFSDKKKAINCNLSVFRDLIPKKKIFLSNVFAIWGFNLEVWNFLVDTMGKKFNFQRKISKSTSNWRPKLVINLNLKSKHTALSLDCGKIEKSCKNQPFLNEKIHTSYKITQLTCQNPAIPINYTKSESWFIQEWSRS